MGIILSSLSTKFRLTRNTSQIITTDTGMSVEKIKQTPLQDLNIYFANKRLTDNSCQKEILPRNIYLHQGRKLDFKQVKDYLRNINMSFTDWLFYKFKNIRTTLRNKSSR